MKAPKGEWRSTKDRYVSGEDYWMGRVRVGSVHHDATLSKGSAATIRAGILLPGISLKQGLSLYSTADEAKAVVERVAATWFRWLDESPALPDKQVGMSA